MQDDLDDAMTDTRVTSRHSSDSSIEPRHRRFGERFEVTGTVQGVTSRPFVFRLANDLGLGCNAGNDSSRVVVDVAGPPAALDEFETAGG